MKLQIILSLASLAITSFTIMISGWSMLTNMQTFAIRGKYDLAHSCQRDGAIALVLGGIIIGAMLAILVTGLLTRNKKHENSISI